MRKCPSCGKRYEDNVLYCTDCGVKTKKDNPTPIPNNKKRKIVIGAISAVIIGSIMLLISNMSQPKPKIKQNNKSTTSATTVVQTDYAAQADKYFDAGEYQKAVDAYTEAIKQNPQKALYYNDRGVSYQRLNNFDKAFADYNQAIKLDDTPVAAYGNRGYIYYKNGDYDKAISDYNQAIKLKSDNANYWNRRGLVYEAKKDYNKAAADFKQAAKLAPNDENIKKNLQRVSKK